MRTDYAGCFNELDMKNIKDYLHLYVGCEAQYYGYHQQWRGINNAFTLMGVNDEEFTVKLILRPLSDMTEEEKESCEMVYMRMQEMADEEGHVCDAEMWAETTRWLVSKGFDVFQLIEEGLAIDKTTLNSNPTNY